PYLLNVASQQPPPESVARRRQGWHSLHQGSRLTIRPPSWTPCKPAPYNSFIAWLNPESPFVEASTMLEKPKLDVTRRDFVVSTLAAGFALAVQPVSAETINTDTKGLEAGEVKIPVGKEETIPAYRAMPEKGGLFPVVLVVQEIFGVHEHIKDV